MYHEEQSQQYFPEQIEKTCPRIVIKKVDRHCVSLRSNVSCFLSTIINRGNRFSLSAFNSIWNREQSLFFNAMISIIVISLILRVINGLGIVSIHGDSVYRPQSPCALIRNLTLSSQDSMQTCLWKCANELDCQTAVFFDDVKICSMFVEFYGMDRILPSGNVRASVIVYRKNHSELILIDRTKKKSTLFLDPIPTCPSTAAPKYPEDTTLLNAITYTTPRMSYSIGWVLV
jgi:hypothetical protein